MCSHTRMTSSTSCSTSRIAMPSRARSMSRSPKASVSLVSRPEPGSSRRSSWGRVARARPSSTRRARPVGIESTGSSATDVSPTRSRISLVSALGSSFAFDQPFRISAATMMFSRAVSDPNTSSRWNVRAMFNRARLCGFWSVTSSSPMNTLPCVGVCSPVMTLNNVVLPAPSGPISPVIRPASAARLTLSRAKRPPKRTLTSSTRSTGKLPDLLYGTRLIARLRGFVIRELRMHDPPDDVAEPCEFAGPAVGVPADTDGAEPRTDEREVAPHRPREEPKQLVGLERTKGHPAHQCAGDGVDSCNRDQQEHHAALQDLEVVRSDLAVHAAVEAPGDTGEGGTQGEDGHLGERQVQAQRGAGRRAVLHGHEPPAEGTTSYGEHPHPGETEHGDEEDEEHLVALEGHTEDVGPPHREPPAVPEHVLVLEEDRAHALGEGERAQRQVQTLQPQRGQGGERADGAGEHGREQDSPQRRAAEVLAHDECAEADERHLRQRCLPGVADEQHQREHDQREHDALAEVHQQRPVHELDQDDGADDQSDGAHDRFPKRRDAWHAARRHQTAGAETSLWKH